MKRFLSIVVAIVATVMNSNAQNLTATLEQNNSITTYYGKNAFKDAYEAASSGATITLSAGYFYTVEKISKSITIIGCGGLGYSSLGKYTEIDSNYNSNTKISTHFAIEANNVRLEGLYLGSHVYIGSNYNSDSSISNLKISNCHIGTLYGNWKYKNVVINQCYISSIHNTYFSENLCIKNSYIVEFRGMSTGSTNPAYITNCIIPHFSYYYYDGTSFDRSHPIATYKNCILGYSSYNYKNSGSDYYMGYRKYAYSQSNDEYYNNVFYLYPWKYEREDNSNSFSEKTVTASDSLKRITISPPSGDNSCIAKNNIGVSYNNLFNTSKSWFDSAYVKVDAKGDDGKPVGLYGGTGFSPYPNIPRIVDSQIDSNTDEAGKLNVKIKVEVNK